jgi:hypothetical protein
VCLIKLWQVDFDPVTLTAVTEEIRPNGTGHPRFGKAPKSAAELQAEEEAKQHAAMSAKYACVRLGVYDVVLQLAPQISSRVQPAQSDHSFTLPCCWSPRPCVTNRYQPKVKTIQVSKFMQLENERLAEEAAAERLRNIAAADAEARASRERLYGQRVHSWVLVRAGKRVRACVRVYVVCVCRVQACKMQCTPFVYATMCLCLVSCVRVLSTSGGD